MKDTIHHDSNEELASYSLRSTHELVEVLGKAKRAYEKILHESEDLFGLITAEGRILSGNQTLAKLMGLESELILDNNLGRLFTSETWTIVRSHFSRINSSHDNSVKFEIPIDGVDKNRLFEWSFSVFHSISDRRGQVYVVIAKDISALRGCERKITNIVACLPFGFLTINDRKKIEPPWSRYAEIILGTDKLDNRDIESLFLECLIPSNGHDFKEWVTTLLNLIGGDEESFHLVRHIFPFKLPLVAEGHRAQIKWLRMSYSPLVCNGRISKILVIFEEIADQVDPSKKLE